MNIFHFNDITNKVECMLITITVIIILSLFKIRFLNVQLFFVITQENNYHYSNTGFKVSYSMFQL